MKKLLTSLLLLQVSFGICQTTLSGKIKLSEKFDSKFYILKLNQFDANAPIVYDSIAINSTGEFNYVFANNNPQDLLYKILLPPKSGNRFHIYDNMSKNFFFITTENQEKINLVADADSLYYSYKIGGKGINNTLATYRNIRTPVYNIEKVYTDSINSKPELESLYKQKMFPVWMSNVDKARDRYANILDTAKNTSIILIGILNLYESNFGKLDSASTSKYLSRIKNKDLLAVKNLRILAGSKQSNRLGMILPDVALRSSKGMKRLHEIKSNILVIDFWASWCAPCRYANKNELPDLYSKYKDKVKMIGISVDNDEKKWKNAVIKDNTEWSQYIDRNYLLKNLIGAQAVPVYIVLDKDYKIIYETMSAYQLRAYLDNAFK
jgi:thiol-disulfide isomerase/thioredoxin